MKTGRAHNLPKNNQPSMTCVVGSSTRTKNITKTHPKNNEINALPPPPQKKQQHFLGLRSPINLFRKKKEKNDFAKKCYLSVSS